MRGPLCVARSTILGNAKASKSGASNGIGTTLFVDNCPHWCQWMRSKAVLGQLSSSEFLMNNVIKTLISSIVITLTLVFPYGLCAQNFTYTYKGQSVNYTVIDQDAKTCRTKAGFKQPNNSLEPGNEVGGNVTIPELVKYNDVEYTVVEIGWASFASNIYIKK